MGKLDRDGNGTIEELEFVDMVDKWIDDSQLGNGRKHSYDHADSPSKKMRVTSLLSLSLLKDKRRRSK